MTAHNSIKRARKYHHLTCSNCRRRKTKCDGTEPICTTCKGFGDTNCTYDKPASIAYVRHLEKQVQSLSKELENVKISGGSSDNESITTNTQPKSKSPRTSVVPGNSTHITSSGLSEEVPVPPHTKKRAASAFGITSNELELLTNKQIFINNMDQFEQKNQLTNLSSLAGKIEDYALEAALTGSLSFIGINMAKQLLSYFWSWIHPYQMHIYRPVFFRHMATYDSNVEPPSSYCYSPALLCMILAESARLLTGIESELYQVLDQIAFSFITQDLKKGNTLANASACLSMSSRAMAMGNASLSWNFSGIAIRMAIDLEVQFNPENLNRDDVTVEEAEARRRLALGIYNHDQLVGLYEDRESEFECQVESEGLLDNCFDVVIWDPIVDVCGSSKLFINGNGQFDDENEEDEQPIYQPNKSSHCLECFKWQSKLMGIMNRIVKEMRGNVSQIQTQSDPSGSQFTVVDTINQLEQFWSQVPDQLKITPDNSKTLPHIVSFNLCYHVCFALLLLPVFQQCPPHVIDGFMIMHSIKASTSMRQCLASQVALFGTNCTPFFHTYSAYLIYQLLQVSLTEFTDRAQDEFDRDTAVENLNFFTRMFKVCVFSLAIVDSTVMYAHNRTRREVAFASQRAASALTSNSASSSTAHSNVDFMSFPGPLGITFESNTPFTRHMSLDVANDNDLPQPPTRYYQQQQPQRSKSIIPADYTTQAPQLPQESPVSPNLQDSHYMTFPDLQNNNPQQQRSMSYANVWSNDSWNNIPYVVNEFDETNNQTSPSPRTLQSVNDLNIPISNLQWQEPERLA